MSPFLIITIILAEQSVFDVAISQFGRLSRLSNYLVARKTLYFISHLLTQ